MNVEYLEILSTIWGNKNIDEFIRIANEANDKIEEWYDRDFDMSDHITQIAKFGVSVGVSIGIGIGIAFVGIEGLAAAAVAAGFQATYKVTKSYEDGSNGVESLEEGAKSFVFNFGLGMIGSAGSAASQSSKESLEEITKEGLEDAEVGIAKKSEGDVVGIKNKVSDNLDLGKAEEEISANITKEKVKEIVADNTTGAMSNKTIEEFTDYLNENTDLEASDEAIKILLAVFKEG